MVTTSADIDIDIDTNVPPPPRVQGTADDQVRALQIYSHDLSQRLRAALVIEKAALETIKTILDENGM